jgi:hypothetical protein
MENGDTGIWLIVRQFRRHAYWLPALFLLALSWYLAKWPPIGPAHLDSRDMGLRLLIAGAVPWYLQWAGLAILATYALLGRLGCDREITSGAIVVPLIVGSAWWAGIVVLHWSEDPLEFVAETIFRTYRHELGTADFCETLLFQVLGPLMCPLVLHGPYTLNGWIYFITLISTLLVIAWGLWVGRRLRTSEATFRSLFVVGLVYSTPVLLRVLVDLVIVSYALFGVVSV